VCVCVSVCLCVCVSVCLRVCDQCCVLLCARVWCSRRARIVPPTPTPTPPAAIVAQHSTPNEHTPSPTTTPPPTSAHTTTSPPPPGKRKQKNTHEKPRRRGLRSVCHIHARRWRQPARAPRDLQARVRRLAPPTKHAVRGALPADGGARGARGCVRAVCVRVCVCVCAVLCAQCCCVFFCLG
jgi:hypothetical protein